jgi:outer membrane protein OmpA-like peptidoglycan-associated protein
MMMKLLKLISIAFIIAWISPALKAQTDTLEGCKDYPGFTRKPGYKFRACNIKDYDTVLFPVGNSIEEASQRKAVDGKYYLYFYTLNEGIPQRFPLLVFRDFEDSLRKCDGYVAARVVDASYIDSYITGKIEKENMTIWLNIRVYGSDYLLAIVEKPRKIQVITADSMWNSLEKRDSVTVDIFFEDDTTVIIPDSYPVIDQVVKMLVDHPDLQISIQSHIDKTLHSVSAKVLTANRAKVVLDAFMAKGIEKARLKSLGWGYDKPIGDNRTEEGRTMNRRIVIVRRH